MKVCICKECIKQKSKEYKMSVMQVNSIGQLPSYIGLDKAIVKPTFWMPKAEEHEVLKDSRQKLLTSFASHIKEKITENQIKNVESAAETLKTLKQQIMNDPALAMQTHKPGEEARGLLINFRA